MESKFEEFRPSEMRDLIRVGSKNDGGYIIPARLKFDFLISFGLGDNWDFEKDSLSRGIVKDFVVYDHSVSFETLLKKFLRSIKRFIQDPKNSVYRLSILLEYIVFFRNKNHYKLKVVRKANASNEISAQEILEYYADDFKSGILKIDIEGGEWEILNLLGPHMENIDLIILELHDFDANFQNYLKWKKRLSSKYELVHAHINNFSKLGKNSIPEVMEMTFVNKAMVQILGKRHSIPVANLDAPCTPNRPDYVCDFESNLIQLAEKNQGNDSIS